MGHGEVVSEWALNGSGDDGGFDFGAAVHQLFEDAVREALPRIRFIPAEVGGKKVRQLVQMPFVFTLAR